MDRQQGILSFVKTAGDKYLYIRTGNTQLRTGSMEYLVMNWNNGSEEDTSPWIGILTVLKTLLHGK
jgi:hypothetical protein